MTEAINILDIIHEATDEDELAESIGIPGEIANEDKHTVQVYFEKIDVLRAKVFKDFGEEVAQQFEDLALTKKVPADPSKLAEFLNKRVDVVSVMCRDLLPNKG